MVTVGEKVGALHYAHAAVAVVAYVEGRIIADVTEDYEDEERKSLITGWAFGVSNRCCGRKEHRYRDRGFMVGLP